MKGRPIDQIVYECMFPRPKSTDPQNFQNLLQRQLVPEVRLETQAFYGHLSSQEAKYPGLDYSHQPHRNRLSRYQWHRRLFRAFDNLGLTKSEIASLTKWEGTRWAKERFEKEQGIVIRDTTGDGIRDWVEPELRSQTPLQAQRADVEDMEDVQEDEGSENDMDEDGEDSDTEIQSVGIELNERLRAAVASREAGDTSTVMDEEWEQWLKEAAENGGLPFLASDLSPNANVPGTRPVNNGQSMDPRLLNAARLGQWHQIPDFLHNVVRRNLEASNRRVEDAPLPQPLLFSSTNSASPQIAPTPPSNSTRTRNSQTEGDPDNLFQSQFSRRSVPGSVRIILDSGGGTTSSMRTDLRMSTGRTQPSSGA